MKLALIPPYAHANAIKHTDYQLLLPQCLSNRRYLNAYRRARRDGNYLILDNGVAEGVNTTPEALHVEAHRMMVNEIVVPDTMQDAEATLQQARNFTLHGWVQANTYNYMGVVQGTSYAECWDCIYGFNALPYITTLGIPRHLLTTIGEDARINLVNYIRKQHSHSRFQIHLLGMNPAYTNELISFGRAYKALNVRGIDTSAPFYYALAGQLLGYYRGEVAITRPDNYFDREIGTAELFTYPNIAIMKDWVYGNA